MQVFYRGIFSESGLMAEYRNVLLNSLGAEIKDLTRPDGRTLVYAEQGGFKHHIRLAMQP